MATILIVEDDRNMRLLTSARLADLHTVVTACDGVEALDLLHKGGVDMVVADIMMPRMDGYALLKRIRDEGNNIAEPWDLFRHTINTSYIPRIKPFTLKFRLDCIVSSSYNPLICFGF